ncbi:MAG: hemerythrin family protein [Rhodospirillales bacterium]|nr:hemerythrin family protein [Rhodospirillales bacterium]
MRFQAVTDDNTGSTLPRLEWRDEFSVGVASIDYEHRELIDRLNAIIAKLESGGDRDEILDIIADVNTGISAHFALEETVMRAHGYDHYADHKGDHEHLLDDIRDIMDAVEDGTYANRKQDLAQRLVDWFLIHSKTRDARLHHKLGI